MKSIEFITFDGSADMANQIFGESYGIDWEYSNTYKEDIIVKDQIIEKGQLIVLITNNK